MKKYRVKSAVYNEHNEIQDYETKVLEASNETHAHTMMSEHMLDHFGQEAYDIDTTIEEVLPDDPNWQDRRYY